MLTYFSKLNLFTFLYIDYTPYSITLHIKLILQPWCLMIYVHPCIYFLDMITRGLVETAVKNTSIQTMLILQMFPCCGFCLLHLLRSRAGCTTRPLSWYPALGNSFQPMGKYEVPLQTSLANHSVCPPFKNIHLLILSLTLQIQHSCIRPWRSEQGLAKLVGLYRCLFYACTCWLLLMSVLCLHTSVYMYVHFLFVYCICASTGPATFKFLLLLIDVQQL